MVSNVVEDLSFEDTSSSESATLEPWSPKIVGREKTDKEEGALLVIPAKATVEENPIIDIKASMQKQVALNKPKTGKKTAQHGTAGYCKENNGQARRKTKENTKEQKDP